jgi:hypothetical protein
MFDWFIKKDKKQETQNEWIRLDPTTYKKYVFSNPPIISFRLSFGTPYWEGLELFVENDIQFIFIADNVGNSRIYEIGEFVNVPTFLDKIKEILIAHNYNNITKNRVIKGFMSNGFYLEQKEEYDKMEQQNYFKCLNLKLTEQELFYIRDALKLGFKQMSQDDRETYEEILKMFQEK